MDHRSENIDRDSVDLIVWERMIGRLGEVGESELVHEVSVECGKGRDMTRG